MLPATTGTSVVSAELIEAYSQNLKLEPQSEQIHQK